MNSTVPSTLTFSGRNANIASGSVRTLPCEKRANRDQKISEELLNPIELPVVVVPGDRCSVWKKG